MAKSLKGTKTYDILTPLLLASHKPTAATSTLLVGQISKGTRTLAASSATRPRPRLGMRLVTWISSRQWEIRRPVRLSEIQKRT